MQWLLNSNSKDIPMKGVDWIVLTANGLGLAIVVAATMHASSAEQNYAADDAETTLVIASLD